MRAPGPTTATSSSASSSSGLAIRLAVALALLVVLGIAWTTPATGQQPTAPEGRTGIGISPADPQLRAAGSARWFVADGEPGQEVVLRALVSNPGDVDETVRLYVRDLRFDRRGEPVIEDRSSDIGTWGGFDEPEVLVTARSERTATFRLRVPADADPGDHVGVVVAEAAPKGDGTVRVVSRVGARLYLTVPGEARPAVELRRLRLEPDGAIAPREATVTFEVRNTGNVRVRPRVFVGGTEVPGAEVLPSGTHTTYAVTRALNRLGGRPTVDVRVETQTPSGPGPSVTGSASALVLPLVPLLGLAQLVLLVLAVRMQLRALRGL